MKRALVAVFAVLLIAGCSSMPAATSADDNVDYLYVTRVEQAAKRYGTEVVWINLPQKRSTTAQ